jgi:hemoglobin
MGHCTAIIPRTLKPDIASRQDIIKLLGHFYDKLLKDDVTHPIFKDLDMQAHIPVIADFWSMVLLGEMNYKGNPFEKHVPLGLKKEHFDSWLQHFNSSIDCFFSGEKATLAKQRAHSIAFIFQSKLTHSS